MPIWCWYVSGLLAALAAKLAAYAGNTPGPWHGNLREWFAARTKDDRVSWLSTLFVLVAAELWLFGGLKVALLPGVEVPRTAFCACAAGFFLEFAAPALASRLMSGAKRWLETE